MLRSVLIVVIASLCLIAPILLNAADYYVDAESGDDINDGSQDRPWRTITYALNSAEGSEANPITIHIAGGTYSASTNGETFPLNMKSWVSVRGEGRNTTILDAEGEACHVILCYEVSHLTIEGLTITGGYADSPDWSDYEGAGIYCWFSSPTIRNNIIAGNRAPGGYAGGGAGVYCFVSGAKITNNTISDNVTEGYYSRGGGICCLGGIYPIDSDTIADNVIMRNSAGFAGGGIYCYGSPSIISGNVISGNSAGSVGGGIDCRAGSPRIHNNTIADNTSDGDGGGISCFSSAVIEGNHVVRNQSQWNGGGIHCKANGAVIRDNLIASNSADRKHGGGIYCEESSPLIQGNAITTNSAGWSGGGVHCRSCDSPTIDNNLIARNGGEDGAGISCTYGNPTVSNCTIADNYSPSSFYKGGGVWAFYSDPTIMNCIIWGNDDDLIDCSAIYCCIEDLDEGEGNIHSDPMFVAGAPDGYYLHPDSPCIDAGSRSAADAGLSERTTQLDGSPDAGLVDMGYHHPILGAPHDVAVECSLNKDEYTRGDLMKGFMAADNRGAEVKVDVYIAFLMPDGSIYSLISSGLEGGIAPWLTNVTLPPGFTGPEKVFEFPVPVNIQPGRYCYGAALAPSEPPIDFLATDMVWFEVTDGEPVSDYYVDAQLGEDGNDGSEEAPWKTITYAVDSVGGSSDNPITLHVAAGAYSASASGETFPLNMKSFVSLIGDGRETTVLDAEASGSRVISIVDVDELTVEGLSITGGRAPEWPNSRGGGILCVNSSPLIQDNRLHSNSALSLGGAICSEGGTAAIRGNVIADNFAYGEGSGIACEGGTISVECNTISDNESRFNGGGVNCRSASLLLYGNTIVNNEASYLGGGVNAEDCSLIVDSNVIADNLAGDYGGALCCLRGPGITIRNNAIIRNEATIYGGGGIYWDSDRSATATSAVIVNNLMLDNSTDMYGGAIYGASPLTSESNTIVGNVAKYGGGIFGNEPVVINCVFQNNRSTVFDHRGLLNQGDLWAGSATYCCIERSAEGEGNIHDDPMFVSGPLGDYYLDPDSPCIDAGSRSAVDAGLSDRTTQADGAPDTGVVDMGFHYPIQ